MSNKPVQIVLATHNAGKVRELADPLSQFGVEVLGLEFFPTIGEIDETGTTFEENACIKAREVARLTGLISIADDSGLEVDALDGRPGVYSARYSDDWESLPGESRDVRNIRKLLHELANVRGVWDGRLLTAPRGENGFGYDPVFFDAIVGKTAAELTRDEKNARSHRGNALRALLAKWQGFMSA